MGKLGDTLDSAVGLLDMLKKPPGSDPRYRGVAPNRTDFTFMRYNPAKLPERLQKSLTALRDPNNPMRQDMLESIEAGLEVGEDWYNTEELRDWFIMGHGEEEGMRQWTEYLDLVGATSPGSKVPANIGNASAVRNRLYTDPEYLEQLQNVENIEGGRALAKGRQPGYGHKTAGLQELIVSKQTQGKFDALPEPGVTATKSSMVENPKPKGFGQSLKGSEKNIAADLHFTRYFGMASMDPDWLNVAGTEVGQEFADKIMSAYPKSKKYFATNKMGKPSFNPKAAVKDGVVPIEDIADNPGVWSAMPNNNEYGAMEDFMFELGNELGLTGAQVQAALWMGAARKTKVDPTSQTTFMGAIRDRADIQAAKRGQTREQVLFDFIMNKGLLAVPAAAPLGVLGLSGPNQAQAAPTENDLLQYLEANR
jgi:hypothetical protein